MKNPKLKYKKDSQNLEEWITFTLENSKFEKEYKLSKEEHL
jgi:hypothetical protein